MRKERIIAAVHRWQRPHPTVSHYPLDCEFTRYTEKVSCDGSTSRLVPRTRMIIEDLRRHEVAVSCFVYVLCKGHF